MDPTAKESTPKQENKSNDPFLSIFDSIMSVPSSLAEGALNIGIELAKFTGGLAKGLVNLLVTDNNSQPVKAA